MQKDFPGWHRQKEQLHAQRHTPTFQEREIWWCSVGVNIGHEMDGKNQFYHRPVLIVRTLNPHIFFGVPLTTKIKQNPYSLILDSRVVDLRMVYTDAVSFHDL